MAESVARKIRTRGPRTGIRIFEAAHRLFLDHGFAETTMEAIAQEAGVSKATLYAHYGSREELFTAVITAAGERFSEGVLAGAAECRTVRDRMEHLARAVLDLLLSPDVVAFNRIVSAEALRFPDLGKLFYDNGPDRLIGRLAAMLDEEMSAGWLRPSASRAAAKHFIGLVQGDLLLRAMLGDETALTDTQRREAITGGVQVFLAAYAPTGPDREP